MFQVFSLVSLAMAAGSVAAGFAPTYWGVLDANNQTAAYITKVSTTLKAPAVPSQQGLFLWPGMFTEGGYLVQSIITNGVEYVSGYVAPFHLQIRAAATRAF